MLARHAEENGCLTMVGLNRRFAPLFIEAKKAMDKAGGVQLCRAVFHKHQSAVYFNGATDALSCDGIHVVDLLRFMAGEVKSLESAVTHFPLGLADDVPNSWIAVLRFENGAVGELSAHWAAATRRLHCEMHNPRMSILCEPEAELVIMEGSSGERRKLTAREASGSEDARIVGGYKQENDHFIECLRAGRQPQPNFAEVAKSSELVERIWQGKL
jgi:virulence factor